MSFYCLHLSLVPEALSRATKCARCRAEGATAKSQTDREARAKWFGKAGLFSLFRRRTLLAGPAASVRPLCQPRRAIGDACGAPRLDTWRDNGKEGSSTRPRGKGDGGVWCDVVFSDLTMHVVNKESRQHWKTKRSGVPSSFCLPKHLPGCKMKKKMVRILPSWPLSPGLYEAIF